MEKWNVDYSITYTITAGLGGSVVEWLMRRAIVILKILYSIITQYYSWLQARIREFFYKL